MKPYAFPAGRGVDLPGKVRPIQGDTILGGRILRGPLIAAVREPCDNAWASTPSPRKNNTVVPLCAFSEASGIYPSDMGSETKPRLEVVASRRQLPTQARERAGRIAFSLIVQMSSNRLFLERVARQQSPSPLHRLSVIVLEKMLEVERIPANCNRVFSSVSHRRGSPHNQPLPC